MSYPRHVPTFENVVDWEQTRTTPCWAVCDCGWESDVMPDQTTAETAHGHHLMRLGLIPTEDD